MAFSSRDSLLAALEALGKWVSEQPVETRGARLELFICGGACFLFHGLPRHVGVTNDVDVWGQFENGILIPLTEWSPLMERGIEVVRKKFPTPLPQGWLSCEASFKLAVHFGLPAGAKARATVMDFGPRLRASFSARHDLVAFKFLALIAAQHQETRQKARGDLLALGPTVAEIKAARQWLLNVPKANPLWKKDCEKAFSKWRSNNH